MKIERRDTIISLKLEMAEYAKRIAAIIGSEISPEKKDELILGICCLMQDWNYIEEDLI